MQTGYQRHQSGFTLLELVLVLFLIGLLASAGLLFTENQEDQAYFDETQRRLNIIQDAIIRSGERTVNSQPELAGFVVDNGRIPYCLAELVGPEFTFTDNASAPATHYQSPCDAANTALTLRKPSTSDSGLRTGWWGPYIQVNPDRDGERVYRDGYGNDDGTVNYGWNWTLFTSSTIVDVSSYDPTSPTAEPIMDLTVQSSGFDVLDSIDDYPPDLTDYLLIADDWLAEQSYTVRFFNVDQTTAISGIPQSPPDSDEWILTLANSAINFESDTFTMGTSAVPSVDAGNNSTDATANFSERIPAGHYLVSLECDNDLSGDCVTANVSGRYRVTVLPRQQLAPIRWNVKPR